MVNLTFPRSTSRGYGTRWDSKSSCGIRIPHRVPLYLRPTTRVLRIPSNTVCLIHNDWILILLTVSSLTSKWRILTMDSHIIPVSNEAVIKEHIIQMMFKRRPGIDFNTMSPYLCSKEEEESVLSNSSKSQREKKKRKFISVKLFLLKSTLLEVKPFLKRVIRGV